MIEELFKRAMDPDEPWIVREVKRDATAARVDFVIDFVHRVRFARPSGKEMHLLCVTTGSSCVSLLPLASLRLGLVCS